MSHRTERDFQWVTITMEERTTRSSKADWWTIPPENHFGSNAWNIFKFTNLYLVCFWWTKVWLTDWQTLLAENQFGVRFLRSVNFLVGIFLPGSLEANQWKQKQLRTSGAFWVLPCPRQRQITPKSLVKLLRPNLDRGEETVRDDLRHVMLPLYLPSLPRIPTYLPPYLYSLNLPTSLNWRPLHLLPTSVGSR